MAIFERQPVNRVVLDDTEALACVIENWRTVNGHTEFVVKVQRGPLPDTTWRVYKRYNDFHKLHSHLQVSGIPLQLPPKRLLGNMDPEFISERLQGLQRYLNSVVMNPILVSSLPARSFIDPVNYCQPFGELALQHVSLALRGEVGWEVTAPIEEVGWRLRKHYYSVRCKMLPKEELLGGWTDYGPDKFLEDRDMHAVLKSLTQIEHPFIHSIDLGLCTDTGALVVRSCHKHGSLRDLICGAKPRQSFLKKYGNPKGHKPLDTSLVALYGRQILEGLKFLDDKGFPYGHLHSGNVIIVNDRVKLVDIENGILGVPSFYRPYFMQHRKINTLQAIDVYCFGHTLYEMTIGAPLHESTADGMPDCSPLLKSVIQSILSSEALKLGLPTVESLLKNPFFASVVLNLGPEDKSHFKIPTSVKDRLKGVTVKIEERLKEEQRMVRSQKRLVKVQEMMSSEEEKKKQRHRFRQMAREKEKHKASENNNGKSHSLDRPDSVNSSAATSIGTATPPSASGSCVPSPPPPPPPPLGFTNGGPHAPDAPKERSALLGAICNFNKTALRKTKVN